MFAKYCPRCGAATVFERLEPMRLSDRLTVHVPVLSCVLCEFKWTDERAEAMCAQVIESHEPVKAT